MTSFKVGDIIKRAQTKVDKDNTDLEYYVGGEHILTDELVVSQKGLIAGSTIGPMFYYGFKPGDFLLVSRNPHLRKSGRVDFSGICSEKTFVLESKDPDILLPDYLPFVFQNERFWSYAEKNKHGSTNFFINWSTLADYEFELPEVERQKELSELLWAIEDLRHIYKAIIRESANVIKSRFVEMFGYPGEDRYGWGLGKLGEYCAINPRKPKDLSDSLPCSFVPMPAIGEKGEFDASETRLVKDVKKGFTYFRENDVLFAKITPCMQNGKGAIARGLLNSVGFGSTEFHVLRPLEQISDPVWIYTILSFPEIRINAERHMTGTGGQRRVPVEYLSKIKISCPPISLQQEFAAFVQQIDKSQFTTQSTLDSLDATSKAILNEELGLENG